MTRKDEQLIEDAYQVPYDNYCLINSWMVKADTDECKQKLRHIRNFLYDIYINER